MLPGVVCSVDLAGSVGEEVGLGAVGVGEEGLAEGQEVPCFAVAVGVGAVL